MTDYIVSLRVKDLRNAPLAGTRVWSCSECREDVALAPSGHRRALDGWIVICQKCLDTIVGDDETVKIEPLSPDQIVELSERDR